MAALTAERDTRRTEYTLHSFPVAATTTIYKGAMVGLSATGYLVPASAVPTITVMGRAEETVDNSTGADGDKSAEIRSDGAFSYDNSAAADELLQADLGSICYAADDQTVAKTDGGATRPKAGYVQRIDPDTSEVWVLFRPFVLP